jgi:hypothetical protein
MLRPMPIEFPEDTYLKYRQFAAGLLPKPLSDEDLRDPHERRRQFDQAWLAARYRYRACADSSIEYKLLFDSPPETWSAGRPDEEYEYKLERCLCLFFTSALSVLESLAFGLYFIGNAVSPAHFKYVSEPRKITLNQVRDAFGKAFPKASLSAALRQLTDDNEYDRLSNIRNVLAHKLVGARNIRSAGIAHPDGRYEEEKWEVWHLAGSDLERKLDNGLTQRRLDGLNGLLSELIPACLEFVESNQPAGAAA